jgi:hypothetical protein
MEGVMKVLPLDAFVNEAAYRGILLLLWREV